MTNTPKNYAEIATDLVAKVAGAAVVASSGAVATVATAALSVTAGLTVGTTAVIYNQFSKPENQVDTYAKVSEAVNYTGSAGYKAFNYVSPMLFSAGYTTASVALKVTGYALNEIYQNSPNVFNATSKP